MNDVAVGLVAGALPWLLGLTLSAFQTSCGGPTCLLFSTAAGLGSGALVAVQQRRRSASGTSWFAAASVAALAAVLGCSALGVLTMLGVVAALALGTGLGALIPAR